MKKVVSIIIAFTAFATIASAQQNEYEYIKTQFHADKKTLLMHYMSLNDSAAAIFWPIYGNYEKERTALADERYNNLKMYASQYKTMTNDQADKMVDTYFDNKDKEESIEKKYYGQMKKALGAKTAASWIQFEEYIDAAVQFQLLDSIPFLSQK
jgi:hypothetical protein